MRLRDAALLAGAVGVMPGAGVLPNRRANTALASYSGCTGLLRPVADA